MRRSIYNDYRPLRIVLLLLLVVLGLFIYIRCSAPCEHEGKGWEISKEATCSEEGIKYMICTKCDTPFGHKAIPTLPHTPLAEVEEVKSVPNCTQGGAHDVVVNCKDCGYEISRVEVADEALGHKPGVATNDNVVNSTHANEGSYDKVVRCVTCKEVLDSVTYTTAPLGHNYTAWEVKYDEETKEFYAVGSCSCDEDGNTVTVSGSNYLTVTRNEAYAPCCKNEYTVKLNYTYTFNGKKTVINRSFTMEIPTESHKLLIEKVKDEVTGEVTIGYIALDDLACEGRYFRYYDLSNEMVAEHIHIDHDAKWDDNGFTSGAYFVCGHCTEVGCDACADELTWIWVRLYSAEHDKNKD